MSELARENCVALLVVTDLLEVETGNGRGYTQSSRTGIWEETRKAKDRVDGPSPFSWRLAADVSARVYSLFHCSSLFSFSSSLAVVASSFSDSAFI